MESKKINQLATELAPVLSDLTIIGDPTTGISRKITLSQMASLFTGTVEEYPNLASFPLVGTADTIYIALDTNVLYRWNTGTNAYVELSPNIINSLVFNDANGFDGTISLVGSTATLTITTALTTGSVGFIGASGALTQDNSNFFWNNSTKRLGINTNAPTTALDVFGSGIIGRLNGTSTNNSFLGFASAGTNKWSIGNVQSDHRFRIYSEANTSELVSVLQTGEFGIGIANPTTKLHIDGGASALITNLDANVSVAKSISFRSDNSNRINLEVSGTESGSNAGADLFIRRYSDAGALIDTALFVKRSTGNIGLATLTPIRQLSLYGGTIGLYNSSTGETLTDGYTMELNGLNGFLWNYENGSLNFGTNNTSRLVIASTGGATFSSSITSTKAILGASSATSSVANLEVFGSTTVTTNNGQIRINDSTTTTKTMSLGVDGTSNVGFIQSFQDGVAYRSLILNGLGGNVGIGLTNPTSLLHISGSSTTYGVAFSILNTSNSKQWNFTAVGGGAGSRSGNLEINNNAIDIIAINQSGFVGIGTTTPSTPLHIVGGKSQLTIDGGAGSGSGFLLNTGLSGSDRRNWFIGTEENIAGDFVIKSSTAAGGNANSGTTRLSILSNGNIGINTSNAGHKLEVNVNGGNGSTAAIANLFGGSNIANQNCYLYLGNTNVGMSATVDGGGTPRNNLYAFANGAGVVLNSGATSWTSNSDETIKDIIEPITNAIDKIINFRTVIYKFKNEEDKRRLGLIAQDVELSFPEIVSESYSNYFEKDVKGVAYTELIPVIIKAIQELNDKIK